MLTSYSDLIKSQSTLCPPATIPSKRLSNDNLAKEYGAWVDEKEQERKKKDNYVQKEIRQRKKQLGQLPCCQCQTDTKAYEKGSGSVCSAYTHYRCVECIVIQIKAR